MSEERPTPEEMLARALEEQSREGRGRLKVFFGAAPGVGKTYAMLLDGLREKAAGTDVVLGWVETHGRAETEGLTRGFERLAPRAVQHRGITLREFDLDAALARRPGLLLVDELPHTNAPGSRHAHRWQDVEELLDAGIDVVTTLNVQHLESLNDVVAQITGIRVRETVPDAVVDRADTIELVDLPPEELIERLNEGKVYVPEQAGRALESFFRRGNLIALRELSLRKTADRVDAEALRWRRDEGITAPWPVGDRVLVAVGPAPSAADVVRAGARMAGKLHAPWIAASVETPGLSERARAAVAEHLALAEQLGAETTVLRSDRPVDTLLSYARRRNVSRIVVGRPTHPRWRDRLYGSFIDAVTRGADGIEVLVTSGEAGGPPDRVARLRIAAPRWQDLGQAALVIGLAVALGFLVWPMLNLADIAMIFILAITLVAMRVDRVSSLAATVLAVASFNFFFVEPYYTFSVSDLRFVVTFGVMLGVGVVVSTLTQRVRAQADAAREREWRTAALYEMTRDLAGRTSADAIATSACAHIRELLGSDVVLLRRLPTTQAGAPGIGGLELLAGPALETREQAVARWVVEHGESAGVGTETLPGGAYRFVPLSTGREVVGALGVAVSPERPLGASPEELLQVLAANVGVALARAWLADASEHARLVIETERMRTTLLSSVSHDLRTPLASITGAATAALEAPDLSDDERRGLLATIRDEGERLHRLIAGLQQLTQLEAIPVANKDWVPVDEVVASATDRLRAQVSDRAIRVRLPHEILLVPMDPVLVDQLLFNLLDNAVKYAPEGTIEVRAWREGDEVLVTVADEGPGIPTGAEQKVFERFWRAPDGRRTEGHGLGLAIAAAIAKVHGGRVFATNREGGGAVLGVALPIVGDVPVTEEVSFDTPESPPHASDPVG